MVMQPFFLTALLIGVAVAVEPAPPTPAAMPDLRVMTFNVRNSKGADGINQWDQRRDLFLSRITLATPDLLGLQEVLNDQRAFLTEKLGDYTVFGVGRDDGKAKGEQALILYRTARFAVVASGTVWLSETPEVPGSKGWDAAFPRIATWARLRDHLAGERELLWINTHFDHKGQLAQAESAKRLRALLATQGRNLPHLITGDFNAVPGSVPHRTLLASGDDGVALTDAYLATHVGEPQGTFNGFRSPPQRSEHIDWILTSPAFIPVSVMVDTFHDGPRFPSDHFPVLAVLRWK